MRADARNPRVVIPSYSKGTLFSTPLRGISTFTKFILKKQEMNF